MTSIKASVSAFVFASLFGGATAQAAVLDFDDVSTSSFESISDSNYGDFSWDTDAWVLNANQYTDSGYKNGLTSGDYVLFNAYGNDMSLSRDSAFDFNGAAITGAWNDGLSVRVEGYLGSDLLYDRTVTVDTSGPVNFDFNFAGIDSLVFSSFGGTDNSNYGGWGNHFALDDFDYSINVPEPGSLALMLLALGGIAARRARAI